MNKRKFPVLEFTVLGVLSFVLYTSGVYYFFLKPIQDEGFSDWQYLFFNSVLLIALILIILFFRRSLLSIQEEIEERMELQNRHVEQLTRTYEGTLKALASALDYRDHETWGHSARVVGYAMAMAEKLGLEDDELRAQLAWAGFLHDIGKIGVPDAILLKKSSLSQEEWEQIKRHPQIGYEIVTQISFLQEAAHIILLHHEHYNGGGYPKGLRREDIPLPARIFAVADALDAMTTDRPYRPARKLKEALEEIKGLSGKQFCPKVVEALFAVGDKKLLAIKQQVKGAGDVTIIQKSLEFALK